MRTMKYFSMAVLTLGLAAGLSVFQAAGNAKPKYDIEEIMQKAHKAPKGKLSLFKQVIKGKANEQQTRQLLEYYEELGKNKPPKGDPGDWKKRTDAMVQSAKDVLAHKPDAAKALTKAASCAKCHELHKEDD